jgi:voltage-gated potassium channel
MTLKRWEVAAEWPLAVVGILFLIAYSVQIIAETTGTADDVMNAVIWSAWALFGIDFLVRLALAPQRGAWLLRHSYELVILALPALRPLRLLRLATLLRIAARTAGNALRGRVIVYAAASAVLLVYVGALAVLDSERGAPGANIQSFPDAIWWAVTTITTVGYGDHFPVTAVGRLVAVGLMIGGIAVLGIVTASVASWLVQQVGERTAEEVDPLEDEVKRLRAEVERLQAVATGRAYDDSSGGNGGAH